MFPKKISHIVLLLSISILSLSCASLFNKQKSQNWDKPTFLEFGMDKDDLKSFLIAEGYQVTERNITPIELPTAKESQIQLDVEGIYFGGKKRTVELIFADEMLDMMWILTEEAEEETIKNHLQKKYGDPSHIVPSAWFYLDQQTALRNEPHEVLFISERLKEPYRQWLNSMDNN